MTPLLPLLVTIIAVGSDTITQTADLVMAPYGPARISGMLVDTRIAESSGLAASNHDPDLFWTHNDGGNEPLIFAIDARGSRHGFIRLETAENQDWEDLATFSIDDRDYLAVGDVGDNGGLRKTLVIYILEEPRFPSGQSLIPAHTLRFELDGGPSDIESMAYDARERAFYLLSKRDHPPNLYRLPWPEKTPQPVPRATRVGVVPGIPQPKDSDQSIDPTGWRYRSQPTAMDFSRDGYRAVVLTYRHAYLFQRQNLQESWATAMARSPQLIKLPALPQGEAITFTANGTILVTTEKWPALMLLIKPTK